MALAADLKKELAGIFRSGWTTRDGQDVPNIEDVILSGNQAVTLDGTVLYADLVDSTGLAAGYKPAFAAEIYKAYLLAASRVIQGRGGRISAFDGDRVMAVFLGTDKNTNAVRCGLEINWAVTNLINPAIAAQYSSTNFRMRQVVGVDCGPLFVARTGVRTSNDLVWVGSAANYAAKLCSLRERDHTTFITERVYAKMSEFVRNGGQPRRSMWDKMSWTGQGQTIYASSWSWQLD